jgi:hypothetical protein
LCWGVGGVTPGLFTRGGVPTPRSPELRNLARPPAEAEADLTSPTENE